MSRRTNGTIIGAAVLIAIALSVPAPSQAQRARTPAGRGSGAGSTGRSDTGPRATAASNRNRFVFGAYTVAAPGVSVTSPETNGAFVTSFGPGAGVMVGYDVDRTFTAFASLDVARQGSGNSGVTGTFGLWHFEVGTRARLHLGTPTTTPYVLASVGRRSVGAQVTEDGADESYNMNLSGYMLSVGGGIEHVISPHVKLDAGLELGFGKFGRYTEDGEQFTLQSSNTLSTRLKLGMNWRP